MLDLVEFKVLGEARTRAAREACWNPSFMKRQSSGCLKSFLATIKYGTFDVCIPPAYGTRMNLVADHLVNELLIGWSALVGGVCRYAVTTNMSLGGKKVVLCQSIAPLCSANPVELLVVPLAACKIAGRNGAYKVRSSQMFRRDSW